MLIIGAGFAGASTAFHLSRNSDLSVIIVEKEELPEEFRLEGVRHVRPTTRAVTLGLALAVLAGVGWVAGMIYTLITWPL